MNAGSSPILIAAAHGTRSDVGTATIRRLHDLMRAQRPQIPVVEAWVDVRDPDVATALQQHEGPAIVVPLLLSVGFHVSVDLPAITQHRDDVAISAPLGPDPALTTVLAARLGEARGGNGPASNVVLASAGSSDARAAKDIRDAAELLSRTLNAPVQTAALSASPPLLDDALRASGPDVEIATYLLAEGYFAGRLTEIAEHHRAALVAAPLGAHPAIADLAWRRYDEAARELAHRTEERGVVGM